MLVYLGVRSSLILPYCYPSGVFYYNIINEIYMFEQIIMVFQCMFSVIIFITTIQTDHNKPKIKELLQKDEDENCVVKVCGLYLLLHDVCLFLLQYHAILLIVTNQIPFTSISTEKIIFYASKYPLYSIFSFVIFPHKISCLWSEISVVWHISSK